MECCGTTQLWLRVDAAVVEGHGLVESMSSPSQSGVVPRALHKATRAASRAHRRGHELHQVTVPIPDDGAATPFGVRGSGDDLGPRL